MINKEDKKDVATKMGKPMANKVAKVTDDSQKYIIKNGKKGDYSPTRKIEYKKGYEEVAGQSVKIGSKKHSILKTQMKQGADLSKYENN